MDDDNVKDFVLANIPSEKPFYVNKLGQIKGVYDRILSVNPDNFKKTIVFINKNGKKEQIGNMKLIWITFNPNEVVTDLNIFSIIDPKADIVLHPSNIQKITKVDLAKKMTINRTLTNERQQIVDFLRKEGKASKTQLFELLKLNERKEGIKILSNLIVKMLKENLIERESLAVYKLPD